MDQITRLGVYHVLFDCPNPQEHTVKYTFGPTVSCTCGYLESLQGDDLG